MEESDTTLEDALIQEVGRQDLAAMHHLLKAGAESQPIRVVLGLQSLAQVRTTKRATLSGCLLQVVQTSMFKTNGD